MMPWNTHVRCPVCGGSGMLYLHKGGCTTCHKCYGERVIVVSKKKAEAMKKLDKGVIL